MQQNKEHKKRQQFNYGDVTIELAPKKAPIPVAIIDISEHGLGLILHKRLTEESTVTVIHRGNRLNMRVVWCKQDSIKKATYHCGLTTLGEGVLIQDFFESSLPATSPPTSLVTLDFTQLQNSLTTLNTDDPTVFSQAGFEFMLDSHKAFPIAVDGHSLVIVAPVTLSLKQISDLSYLEAVQSLSVFQLLRSSDDPHAKAWKKIWPLAADYQAIPRKKVLVIDDDADFRYMVGKLLGKHQIQIIEATDGKDGFIKCLTCKDIGLIMTDLKMPKLDGLNMLKKVHVISNARQRQIPVILVSGFATKDDLTAAQHMGVAACLVKPFEEKELLRQVELLMPALHKEAS